MRILILLIFALTAAHANVVETISILSGSDLTGTTEWNNVTGGNVAIDPYPEPIWKAPAAGGKWISYALTGWGQSSVADGFAWDPPTAIFYATFSLSGPASSGQLHIWADDVATVLVDGVTAIGLPEAVNRAVWCAEAPISCTPAMGGTVDLSGLSAGLHTIEIRAWQLWGDTFGVLYEGSVAVEAVPEPATFAMLLPLMGITAFWAWGRRRQNSNFKLA